MHAVDPCCSLLLDLVVGDAAHQRLPPEVRVRTARRLRQRHHARRANAGLARELHELAWFEAKPDIRLLAHALVLVMCIVHDDQRATLRPLPSATLGAPRLMRPTVSAARPRSGWTPAQCR